MLILGLRKGTVGCIDWEERWSLAAEVTETLASPRLSFSTVEYERKVAP